MMGKRFMTVRDVAKVAGVSYATVSMVINKDRRISEKTASIVKKTIDELGYVPRPHHRRTGPHTKSRYSNNNGIRKGAVAFATIGINTYGGTDVQKVMNGALNVLDQHGINLILAHSSNGKSLPYNVSPDCVDGVIVLASSDISDQVVAQLKRIHSVWVTSYRTPDKTHIVGGLEVSGRIAAEYFINRGHRVLAMLSVDSHPSHLAAREGFEFAAHKAGVSVQFIVPETSNQKIIDSVSTDLGTLERSIEPLLERFLGLSPFPTGLFIPDDLMTALMYRLLYKRGIQPNKDFTILSCDNNQSLLAGLYPRPATIELGSTTCGEQAAQLLLNSIRSGGTENGVRVDIIPQIIESEQASDSM